jgi:hypothetical protein
VIPRRLPLFALAVLVGGGCQAKSSADSVQDQPVRGIELHDASGKVTSRVVPGHPCRATIDGLELLIGTQPLVAQLGDVRWSGDLAANGTTFKRNDVPVARMFPDDDPASVGLYSADGTTVFTSNVAIDKAALVSGAGAVVGTVAKIRGTIEAGDRTVTGTEDLLLAALLSAPDVSPEVRGLAACHRLFPPAKAVP